MPQRNVDDLSDDELYRDWVAWIERIYAKTVNQSWNYRMFRLVAGLFEQNTQLQQVGGFVWDWLAQNYVAGASMTLRRELDRQAGTENLLGLLHELQERPSVIDRSRFRATWGSDDDWEADRAFDTYPFEKCEANRSHDHVDPIAISKDIEDLGNLTAKVREHVEQTIAHRTPTRRGPKPVTFEEFHAALRAIDQMFRKYYGLLTHKSVAQTEPVVQFNEFEAFEFPWIQDRDRFDYAKCK